MKVERNLWYLDNGASNHMTGLRSKFNELDERVTRQVKFGDGSLVEIKDKGSMMFKYKIGEDRIFHKIFEFMIESKKVERVTPFQYQFDKEIASQLRRDRIAEVLFSSNLTKCVGCDPIELIVPREVKKVDDGSKGSKADNISDDREVQPNAVALVDSFNYTDHYLGSILGRYDGNEYSKLYEAAWKDPLSDSVVLDGYVEYIKPLLEETLHLSRL
ncbi:hypothetical protein AgCh_022803 [Apium graveolens]